MSLKNTARKTLRGVENTPPPPMWIRVKLDVVYPSLAFNSKLKNKIVMFNLHLHHFTLLFLTVCNFFCVSVISVAPPFCGSVWAQTVVWQNKGRFCNTIASVSLVHTSSKRLGNANKRNPLKQKFKTNKAAKLP